MSDFEQQYDKDIVPEDKIFEDTFSFGKEYVHVGISADDLRRDLISQATQQGIEESKASAFASRTRFYIGKLPDYLEKRYKQDPSIKKFIDLWTTKLREPLNLIGAVWKEDDGSIGCFIDVPKVVDYVNRGESVPNFRIPKEIPDEVKEMALVQALHSVWTHERQHLIQLAQPKVSEVKDKSLKRSALRTKIALATLSSGTGLCLATVILPIPPEGKIPLAGLSMISILGGGALGMIDFVHSNYLVSDEKESYHHQSSQQFNGRTLFQISFEK
ncbi:hypothetical protein HY408_01530 [Candidatus Gottesmanbacteria bacterium]|nr:hypothetical protein [Candidatus Gottesmanbacteria bacterium]